MIPKRLQHILKSRMGLDAEYALCTDSALTSLNWFESYRLKRACGASGEAIPWFTYPAIAFLERSVPKEALVFEFGSGAGTVWWARHCQAVQACEHDAEWARRTRLDLPPHATVTTCEDGPGYARSIMEAGSPDIVVIDGIRRTECLDRTLEAISRRGVIIWDNAEREDGVEGQSLLAGLAWRSIPFHGMGPVNTYAWCTTVWYRDQNILGI